MSDKDRYRLWSEEEYEKNLNDPHRTELNLFDFRPDVVKDAAEKGKRDGLQIEKIAKENQRIIDETKSKDTTQHHTDDEYSYTPTNSFQDESPIAIIISNLILIGCGGFIIYWVTGNFNNATSHLNNEPSFLQAFSFWILVFGWIVGLIMICYGIFMVKEAADDL